jgi:pimeloyl-ACP methyl ester carboxylesterase
MPDHKLRKKIASLPHTTIKEYKPSDNNRQRAIVSTIDSTKSETLIFVHGAPGDLLSFMDYHRDTALLNRFTIVSYDRLGYGYKDGYNRFISIDEQADQLVKMIERENYQDCTLIAHSYGGAVALSAALKDRIHIKNIILIACAVDPQHEKYFWYGKIGKWKMTKWMLPQQLQTAGMEKYTHVKELSKLEPKLKEVRQKCLIIHGTKDFVVPYENFKYLSDTLVGASLKTISLEGENHFIPFQKQKEVRVWIRSFIDHKL